MSERPPSPKPSAFDQILDLLLDALLERQAARRARGKSGPSLEEPAPKPAATALYDPKPTPEPPTPKLVPPPLPSQPTPEPPASVPIAEKPAAAVHLFSPNQPREPMPGEEGWTPPPPLPSINLDRTLRRVFLSLIVLVVLVNVPLNAAGISLSRALPDTTSLIIRDGLVLKGSSLEIYVLENNKLRWISSLEAFKFFGYTWEQVHIVEDSFLNQFEKGRPIHVLLKCESSPHIYAVEIDKKRWIKDIPTFEAEGFVWEDVMFVSCQYLRDLPDGPPIPPDAGPPPQP